GLMFKLYHQFVGTIPVALTGNSPQPPTDSRRYADEPKTRSGSPTYPLDMFAALAPDHKYLNLAVVNATESEQKFDLNVTGCRLEGKATLWQITGKDLDAANRVGQEPQVEIKETQMGSVPGTIPVAPISVALYRLPLAQAQ
ncbi:MAG TPA: alpha-N-arabinofuranosidase, partial [Bryobacteraceae bacterium]|nr:alpha-N-arabinofuranosidase [Bryobacteraceae bacterium]